MRSEGPPEQNPKMRVEPDRQGASAVDGPTFILSSPHFHDFRKPARRLARASCHPFRAQGIAAEKDDRLSHGRRFPFPPFKAGKRNGLLEAGDCPRPDGRLQRTAMKKETRA